MAAPRVAARLAGLFRLVHPFPSLLDGAVVAVVALVAGGEASVAARLGVSMTLLQFSIGAVNDVVDAPRDAGHKPRKPIPAGLVSPATARTVAVATATAGLLLALPSGSGAVALAGLALAIGYAYDLRAKGTAVSWVPLAVGVPLLPVYGWYGATGTLPPVFLALVPIAALEGAALAIANALVDIERDEAVGTGSIARALGAGSAARLVLGLQLLVGVLAVATTTAEGAPSGWVAAVVASAAIPVAGAALGVVAAHRVPRWREVAWEIQAVGAGILAVAWLGALGASGGIGGPGGL